MRPTFLANSAVAGPAGVTSPVVVTVVLAAGLAGSSVTVVVVVAAAVVVAEESSLAAGSGLAPAPRMETSLPSRSNQNGAPSITSTAVRNQPARSESRAVLTV